MSRLAKNKVLLVVTIPTHLRVLMNVADLLQSSGKYEPEMVYYPSAVFDQDCESCRQAPHEAFIWAEERFWPKSDYLQGKHRERKIGGVRGRAPEQSTYLARLLGLLPHRGIYLRLLQRLPFLPSPSRLLGWVHEVWRPIRFLVRTCLPLIRRLVAGIQALAKTYWFLRAVVQTIANSLFPARKASTSFNERSWLQRFFLSAFAKEWEVDSERGRGERGRGLIRRLGIVFSEGLFSGITEQKAFYKAFSELLVKEGPALVVLPEENLFYQSHLAVHAAHAQNVSCVVVPFTIVNTLEWAEAFFDVDAYQASGGWNKILAKAFPHWVLHHRGRRLILPPAQVLGCEYLGVVPDQPWVISSGQADAIAAESQFMCDYYIRAGIRPEKIRMTGTLSDDKLFHLLQYREERLRELALRTAFSIKGKIILIALPPDQFAGGKRNGCEFEDYKALIQFMVGTVADSCASDHTVLINLHPRIKPEDVAFVETLGAKIIAEPIEQLVPLADLYIAVVSATIRLAISCGIPVINYDAYQYGYDDYKGLGGVLEVKLKAEFAASVDSLIHDDAVYGQVREVQKDISRRLCTLDGNAGVRMVALFEQIVVLRQGRECNDACCYSAIPSGVH